MSTQIDKVKKISRYVKWFILISTGLLIFITCLLLFVGSELTFKIDSNFDELWLSGTSNKILLSLIASPIFIFVLASIYFVIKILNLFQQGIFYDDSNFLGYFGFIWSNIALFFYAPVMALIVALLNSSEDKEMMVQLEFDFLHITTLLFMLVLVYVLKVGKQADDENKEFI